jgi:hypothetical protein
MIGLLVGLRQNRRNRRPVVGRVDFQLSWHPGTMPQGGATANVSHSQAFACPGLDRAGKGA